jgi:hypothetical protein
MKPIQTINMNGDPVFAYEINDMIIYDPTMSECGRFSVNPLECYGLTEEQVKALIDLNNANGYEWEV